MARVSGQTSLDQRLKLRAEHGVVRPVWEPEQDLGVRLEGDVATDHVMQEDTQGPDCHPICSVAPVLDPLGRGVDTGS